METANLIITLFIFPAIYFISKHFASSYFNEKGKNLATKEDIGKITAEVKKVESLFTVSTSGEIEYNALKRNALLEYFKALNTWTALLTSTAFKYEPNTSSENNLLLEKIQNAYIEYRIKKEGVFLFLPIEPFDSLSSEASKKIINLSTELKILIIKINNIHLKDENIETKNEKLKQALRDYKEDITKKHREYLEFSKPLIIFLNEQLKETLKK